jgi:hypothetical protein
MRRLTLHSLAALFLAAAPLSAQVENAGVRASELSAAPSAPAALAPLAAPLASPLAAALTPAAVSPEAAPLAAPAALAPAVAAPAAPAALTAAPAAAVPVKVAPPASAAHGAAPAANASAGEAASARSALDELEGGSVVQSAAFDGVSAAPAAAAGDALAARAFSVKPEDFPGGSGAILTTGRTLRALLTKDLAPADLPYSTTLRTPRPVSLPVSLEAAERAPVKSVTDVAFASAEHSGSAGLVRLGSLADGRPVALKAYHLRNNPELLDKFMLEETRSAKLLSDLGVGPQFHGVWRDRDGSWNVVFDIARGDFSGNPVNMSTFHDLETILARLKGAGVAGFADLQMYRDRDGRLSVIDPGAAASDRRPLSPDEEPNYAIYARMEQLQPAPAEHGRRYLAWLKASRPVAYAQLRELIARRDDAYVKPLKDRYPEIFGARAAR